MVLITEDLIRKRAEHNDGEIYSLEEIALHQQNLERIDHIQNWCKGLRILYLQNNLIPKIENLSKLKKLEYLNLALNNIEKIENLEGCESLKKLDLTINFVGDLMSVESLINVHFLEELYLTGNPCTEYPGYREFVVATLPQLKLLDGMEITKSERIVAFQNLEKIRPIIHEKQREHELKRKSEKANAEQRKERFNKTITSSSCAAVSLEEFWSEKIMYTPESRIETHEFMQLQAKSMHQSKDPGTQVKKITRYFAEDGRPYNINTAKIEFNLKEEKIDGLDFYILDVAVYKHLDTALIQCDIQVNYVRVTFKGKVLQLALPDDIQADASYVKRSTTTGHLLITMPKASQEIIIPADKRHRSSQEDQNKVNKDFNQHLSNLGNYIKTTPTTKCSDVQLNVENQIPKNTSKQKSESLKLISGINERAATQVLHDSQSEDRFDIPPLI